MSIFYQEKWQKYCDLKKRDWIPPPQSFIALRGSLSLKGCLNLGGRESARFRNP